MKMGGEASSLSLLFEYLHCSTATALWLPQNSSTSLCDACESLLLWDRFLQFSCIHHLSSTTSYSMILYKELFAIASFSSHFRFRTKWSTKQCLVIQSQVPQKLQKSIRFLDSELLTSHHLVALIKLLSLIMSQNIAAVVVHTTRRCLWQIN